MGEGTTPRMEEVELCQEQQSRIIQDDSMDGIGRVTSGTKTEQLSRATQDDSRDGIGRVASGTKTEQLSKSNYRGHKVHEEIQILPCAHVIIVKSNKITFQSL